MSTFKDKIKDNFITLTITLLVAITTAFSDHIVGRIKLELNKADLRVVSYEKITTDLSNYVFNVENVTEYYETGLTTKNLLTPVVSSYNTSIETIRKQEYVTYALLGRFWKNDDVKRYEQVMETVKKMDRTVHRLSEETDEVLTGKKNKADGIKTKPVVNDLIKLNKELEGRVKDFFDKLAK